MRAAELLATGIAFCVAVLLALAVRQAARANRRTAVRRRRWKDTRRAR